MHSDIPILSLGEIVIVKITSNCIRVHIGIFHIRDVIYSFDLVKLDGRGTVTRTKTEETSDRSIKEKKI